MRIPRRVSSITFTALVVLSSSVFLFGRQAYAESMPMSQTDAVIQQHSQTLTQKAVTLDSTSQQVEDLQEKKQTLAQQLEDNQKAIADLKQKIADKKAAQQAAAKVVTVASVPISTSVEGCGDNFYANFIYMHESGCKTHNPNGSGCDGIGQACPASKVIGPCGYDYACQNAWFTNYANRYGGWQGAYEFWLGHGWW